MDRAAIDILNPNADIQMRRVLYPRGARHDELHWVFNGVGYVTPIPTAEALLGAMQRIRQQIEEHQAAHPGKC